LETRLKAVRHARGWSQLRLVSELERIAKARDLPVASRASLKTQVSRWENGHVRPDGAYAALLAEVYGTTPADLDLGDVPAAIWVPTSAVTGTASAEWLDCMRGLLAEYARTDNAVGPGHLLGIVAQHVAALENMAMNTRDGLARDSLLVASQFAEFAGWLSQDAGDLGQAERWTERADDLIAYEHDPSARAYVLMRKSAIAAERRDPARSVSLAVASARDPERLSPQLQALVHRQVAISHALAGDARLSARAVDTALSVVPDRASDTGHLAYCTPSYVLMESGVAALQLRSPQLAVERLAEALKMWPAGFERDRGLCLARLALAEALRGNLDAACEIGKQAVDVAKVAGSARTQGVLRILDRRLARHGRATVVSEFRDHSGNLS
jgi:transcriptional regulator with XRE-family HTH domain